MKVIRYQVHSMHTLHTVRNISNFVQNRHNLYNYSMDSNHTIVLFDIYYKR
jgi:hypothetical protein